MRRNKEDEIREEIDKILDERINRGMKWVHTRCITATTAILLTASTAGSFLTKYWDALGMAIQTFLEAMKK